MALEPVAITPEIMAFLERLAPHGAKVTSLAIEGAGFNLGYTSQGQERIMIWAEVTTMDLGEPEADAPDEDWQRADDGAIWLRGVGLSIRHRLGRFDLVQDGREEEHASASFETLDEAKTAYLVVARAIS